ncbi:MAG TPA: radical SAM protein [Gemmatimonadaceae bacterium]|nr:radical SAM protein [Gemmatimonadaceae bacterium]
MRGSSNRSAPVLLTHSYYLRYDQKQWRKMKPYAPLSTLIVAALLRRANQSFAFFDTMLSEGVDEYRDFLRAARPKVVAILDDNFNFLTKMCTTRMRAAAFEMIAAAKSAGARVVVNGSDATDQTLAYLDVGADAVIVGEPDETLLELLKHWEDGGTELHGIAGLAIRETLNGRGTVHRTLARRPIPDLDALPFPAWDLIDVERYRVAWTAAHGRLSWNLATSRGCPFACNWCAKPVFGRRYTQRSPENVAAELAELGKAVGADHLWFSDDIFGLTPRWIEHFAREVVVRGAATPFMMQSRADLMTPAAVKALAESRCEEVWLGVESGSQGVLDAMDKGITLDDVRAATRTLKEHGIRACWFVQLGYPGEDWDAILSTRDLIREAQPHDIGVSVAYPLPGTPFYERVRADLRGKANWSDSDDLAMMFRGAYTTDFYREIRDLLHQEVNARTETRSVHFSAFDDQWELLRAREGANRSTDGNQLRRAIAGA